MGGSLEDTTTRITMITFLSLIFLSLASFGNAVEDRTNIKSEIDSVNNEVKNLSDEMNVLLERIEKDGEEIFQNEDLYKKLVDKIEELAQATEYENSLTNLQFLADKLEKASLSSHNKNEKEREMFGILESARKTYLK